MDITIPITGAAVTAVVISIVGYFCKDKLAEIRARKEAFLSHIASCNEKNIAYALMEQKVSTMASQIENDRIIRQWMGDCLQHIAGRLDVDLPERPQ